MTDPGFLSLLPVFVTLAIALSARNVLVGLFTGVLVGVAMVADATFLSFLPALVGDYVVPEVADSYNASVLVLLAFIGGFVKLVERSGGGTAFAALATRWVASRARAELGAWAGGIMIFFSDLGTPLIVGPVFQPLTDRLGVARQKLAFILDSTSSPVAILIPFIGWGVFIMSVIADAFAANGVALNEWDAFVAAIPYQFYAWLAIAMVPALALLGFDYGPMARAQAAAAQEPAAVALDAPAGNAKPVLVWLPLAVLCAALFATLASHGFPFEQVAGADFRAGLSAAYFLAALTLVALMLYTGVRSLAETFTHYVEGMSGMMPIAATLVLAWTLGTVSEALGTGAYVAELARQGLSGALLPAITFLAAALISFATGSSWGTIIIMMPLAVPAALATGAVMPAVIGAVLSGGLFGDHSSPVSETTILSSTGAATTPLEHFRTQLPYALTNGAIAFAGFLLAGYAEIGWIALLAVAAQAATLWFIRRRYA
ncbi:MAG: sodium:proton exchanger [Gammaproteobacteria bacterium]|nr:sodium:proton exchanger [Gammaproteobacteria bacterium]MDH5344198.1 sodium:proton exchanger [Gammaproteobacteria bacterium]